MVVQTIFEALAVIFIFWGIFNEDKFIALEDKIKTLWRNRNGKH